MYHAINTKEFAVVHTQICPMFMRNTLKFRLYDVSFGVRHVIYLSRIREPNIRIGFLRTHTAVFLLKYLFRNTASDQLYVRSCVTLWHGKN